MNDFQPQQTPKRRWLPRGLLVVAALILGAIAYLWHQHDKSECELQAVIAETDRLDPGWRLADLEAARPEMPVEENSAQLIRKLGAAAIKALDKGKVREDLRAIHGELDPEYLPPNKRLGGRRTETLRVALGPVLGVIEDARRMVDFPRGRHAVNVSPGLSETLAHADDGGLAIFLLTLDAVRRTQDGDVSGAWQSCQAIQNVSRSFADEPMEAVQVIRVVHRLRGLRLMERVLAHGLVDETAIARSQKLLEDESNENPTLLALRARRAHLHHIYTQLAANKASLAEAQQFATGNFGPVTWRQEFDALLSRGSIKPAHAWLLRHYNEAVEIAKRPAAEVAPALKAHEAAATGNPPLTAPNVSMDRFVEFLDPAKLEAQRGCVLAALAVEHYRLKHDRWPVTLGDVVAEGLLREVPSDPYDGQPLRYLPTKDGVVIFSVGPDGNGNGAALERQPIDPERLEFRLWDVERRRR